MVKTTIYGIWAGADFMAAEYPGRRRYIAFEGQIREDSEYPARRGYICSEGRTVKNFNLEVYHGDV